MGKLHTQQAFKSRGDTVCCLPINEKLLWPYVCRPETQLDATYYSYTQQFKMPAALLQQISIQLFLSCALWTKWQVRSALLCSISVPCHMFFQNHVRFVFAYTVSRTASAFNHWHLNEFSHKYLITSSHLLSYEWRCKVPIHSECVPTSSAWNLGDYVWLCSKAEFLGWNIPSQKDGSNDKTISQKAPQVLSFQVFEIRNTSVMNYTNHVSWYMFCVKVLPCLLPQHHQAGLYVSAWRECEQLSKLILIS